MKETRLINRFSEKILISGNGPYWAQKLCIVINSGSAVKIFLNFAHKKEPIGR